jgi:hypothetical protein
MLLKLQMKTSEISSWEWVSEPRTQSTCCNRLSRCRPGDWNVISNINSGVCWEFQYLELKALAVTACHDVGLVIGMWLAPINSGVCWEFQNLELKALAVTACHDVDLNVISTYQLWSLLRVFLLLCDAQRKTKTQSIISLDIFETRELTCLLPHSITPPPTLAHRGPRASLTSWMLSN